MIKNIYDNIYKLLARKMLIQEGVYIAKALLIFPLWGSDNATNFLINRLNINLEAYK